MRVVDEPNKPKRIEIPIGDVVAVGQSPRFELEEFGLVEIAYRRGEVFGERGVSQSPEVCAGRDFDWEETSRGTTREQENKQEGNVALHLQMSVAE